MFISATAHNSPLATSVCWQTPHEAADVPYWRLTSANVPRLSSHLSLSVTLAQEDLALLQTKLGSPCVRNPSIFKVTCPIFIFVFVLRRHLESKTKDQTSASYLRNFTQYRQRHTSRLQRNYTFSDTRLFKTRLSMRGQQSWNSRHCTSAGW